MTFSYSVRLTMACKDGTAEAIQGEDANHVAVPAPRRTVDTMKVEKFASNIRRTIETLHRSKDGVLDALDMYKAACLHTVQHRARLVEAADAHDSTVRDCIWYLSSPPYYDSSVMDSSQAASLLPVSVRAIKSKANENPAVGPDLASMALTYYNEKIIHDASNFLQDRQKQNSACSTPLSSVSGHISRASSSRGLVDTTPTEKFSFSTDGVVVPAGGDFRLPITVSRVRNCDVNVLLYS